jgi:hypothetical protein
VSGLIQRTALPCALADPPGAIPVSTVISATAPAFPTA